ncbi:MAG TPA: hypothetical protein DIC34_07995 [Treponema sp.]|nr:hypothetical protein [Treponema sp.]
MASNILKSSSLQKVNSHIYNRLGIHIPTERLYLLESKISRILGKGGYASIEDLVAALEDGHPASIEALATHVTTNHTFFFREESHFSTLADRITEARTAKPVIWSAACSTGEEPYSIIMTLLARGLKDFLVIASDVNPIVLEHMNRGVFSEARMTGVPTKFREMFFNPVDDDLYQILPIIRKHLRIKKINLMEQVRFESPVDHVFCRNLLIYFDRRNTGIIVGNLVRNMKSGGHLFIGKSEVLLSPPTGLRKLDGSVYIKSRDTE